MKLLFDQNLSPELIELLQQFFPGSSHVQLENLATARDTEIAGFAASNEYVVVTKDQRFRPRRGKLAVGKAILIRLGNCSTADAAKLLRENVSRIESFAADQQREILVLS